MIETTPGMPKLRNADPVEPSAKAGSALRRNRLIVGLALAVIVFAAVRGFSWYHPAPAVPVPDDLDQLQPQLRDYLTQLVEAAKSAPRAPASHATLGIAYAANQLWREARRCFENAAQLEPDEPLAHLYVGIAIEELGNHTEALRCYHALVDRFPEFPQGFYRVGKLSLQLGAPDEAEAAFARLVKLEPSEWRGHAGLGEVALRRGDYAAAAAHLEQAVSLDPKSGNAHSLLGLAYRGLGRQEDAQFELARGLDSRNYPMPDAWGETARDHMRLVQDQIEIANHYSLEGAADRAIQMLATAASYSPTNLALLNALAIVLNRADRPAEAQTVLNQLFTRNEDYLPALLTASLVAQKLGQARESIAFAQRAVELSPNSTHSQVALANALLFVEQDVQAIEALRRAAQLDPKNAELQLQMGDVLLLNLDQPDQALEHYRSACHLDPTLISAQIRLARMLIELGDLAGARETLTVIRKLEPAHLALALLEEQLLTAGPEADETESGTRIPASVNLDGP